MTIQVDLNPEARLIAKARSQGVPLEKLAERLLKEAYDRRNSALHDDLFSRGRKIEDELGIDTGVFCGRLKTSGIFKNDLATSVIYGSSMLAWLAAIVFVLRRL